jgi:hypothetical protein
MSGTTGSNSTWTRLLHSAALIWCAVLFAALLMLPFASGRSGTGGPSGLMLAAAICLAAATIAESLACCLQDRIPPLMLMLLGMAIRMVPPLAVCVVLVERGASGPDHLPFVVYLLAFYLVTLALETWLTVSRLANRTSPSNRIAQ